MDTARLMELMSLQRHDFLNHLQVVSGLLQLDRVAQAGEYVKNTAREITRLSRIVHLKVPEAAAAIMLSHYAAAERGVRVEYQVEADLAGCVVPGVRLAPVLETVLLHAVECQGPHGRGQGGIDVGIHAAAKGYLVRILFPEPADGEGRCSDAVLEEAARALLAYGATVEYRPGTGASEILINLPAR